MCDRQLRGCSLYSRAGPGRWFYSTSDQPGNSGPAGSTGTGPVPLKPVAPLDVWLPIVAALVLVLLDRSPCSPAELVPGGAT